ncbi:MAG: phosphate ABC transporter substrate-binding protein [Spirochaetia bacterium]
MWKSECAGRLAAAWLAVALLAGCTASGKAGASASAKAGPAAPFTLQNTGSDTLVNLALAWAERYMELRPDMRISVTGGGSGTGIAALINGTIQIANASREMSTEEIAAAAKNGIMPVRFTVALDAIAVVENPSNPVTGLTISQVSDMYTGKLRRWDQAGGADRPVVLLSRESNSGTYVYFLEQVVRRGNPNGPELFSPETLLMSSSEGITSEVRQNPNAIGYDGLGYVTTDMKKVAIARTAGAPFVLPSAQSVRDGSYPISRPLFMYTSGEPDGQIKAYLDWVMHDGQEQVKELGFVPLPGSGK